MLSYDALSPEILVEADGDVRVVRLNRPDDGNAVNEAMHRALLDLWRLLHDDTDARAVVLTGAGRHFSAGGDMDAMDTIDGQRSSIPRMRKMFELSSALITRVQSMPQPVIAAINGPAAGGGFSLALAADTRICAESARFNAAFVKIGLSGCEMGTSYLLPRIVGPTAAFELLMSGRLFGALEAFEETRGLREWMPLGE